MTDPKEQVVSEALCRNHISGFGEVCAGVCGDSTVPGQPHPCEHALTVWRSDAQEILRALLAGEGNNATAAAVHLPSAAEADVWRDLVERAHHLALCVFKGTTKADYERARHNAAVLANAIDHARQNEQNSAIAGKDASGDVAGLTQASDSLARPSSSPSPTVRDALRWLDKQIADPWDSDDLPHLRALKEALYAGKRIPSEYTAERMAVRDALDHLHAMAPGIRDLDALDAVEKDDESMRSAVRDALEDEFVTKCRNCSAVGGRPFNCIGECDLYQERCS